MAKNGIIGAIDVGTTKVCSIIAQIDDGGALKVAGVGITPSHGLHKGLVVNIAEARNSIRQSVLRAEQSSGLKMASAYIGVTGRHVTSQNSRGVIAITRNDRMVRPEDLRRVLQSARALPIPGDRKLLHAIPRGYALDGQVGVKNPVGMHGFRLDVETHVITGAVSSVQNLVKCIRGIGVEIEDLVLEPLASSEAILRPDEKEAGVILADIGGGTTDIAIFKEGSIWHTAIIPVAGYQVTRDIAIGLGLPFETAEEMKRKYASVMPTRSSRDEEEVSNVRVDSGHSVSTRDLCNIVRARIEELLRLIALEIPGQSFAKEVPCGLVLTGGSSNLAGIEVLAHDSLGIPARVGAPEGIYGISDVLADPAHATGVGLLLWGMKGTETDPNWRGNGVGQTFGRFFSRIRKLVGR